MLLFRNFYRLLPWLIYAATEWFWSRKYLLSALTGVRVYRAPLYFLHNEANFQKTCPWLRTYLSFLSSGLAHTWMCGLISLFAEYRWHLSSSGLSWRCTWAWSVSKAPAIGCRHLCCKSFSLHLERFVCAINLWGRSCLWHVAQNALSRVCPCVLDEFIWDVVDLETFPNGTVSTGAQQVYSCILHMQEARPAENL